MAAGDSVGATPPISAFFGDTPTIELMNMMGIQLDGLGNHNFDKGSAYLRNTLIPLANYPFISSNVVDAQGKTPAQWKPSVTVDTFDGGKVAFVGFTNETHRRSCRRLPSIRSTSNPSRRGCRQR